MKTVWKRRGVAAAVLLLVCGAVYMNWRYSDIVKDNKVLGQSVFMGEDSVSVVVAAPETGLNTADVARIKDIVVNETDYTPEQIKIMEAN